MSVFAAARLRTWSNHNSHCLCWWVIKVAWKNNEPFYKSVLINSKKAKKPASIIVKTKFSWFSRNEYQNVLKCSISTHWSRYVNTRGRLKAGAWYYVWNRIKTIKLFLRKLKLFVFNVLVLIWYFTEYIHTMRYKLVATILVCLWKTSLMSILRIWIHNENTLLLGCFLNGAQCSIMFVCKFYI